MQLAKFVSCGEEDFDFLHVPRNCISASRRFDPRVNGIDPSRLVERRFRLDDMVSSSLASISLLESTRRRSHRALTYGSDWPEFPRAERQRLSDCTFSLE